jgi:Domain of unknown function (DUF4091)
MFPLIFLVVAGAVGALVWQFGSSGAASEESASSNALGGATDTNVAGVASSATSTISPGASPSPTPTSSPVLDACGLFPAAIKIRPDRIVELQALSARMCPVLNLSSPKNDVISLQVACLGPIEGMQVKATLPAPLDFLLYSQALYDVGTPSDCSSEPGFWPDPLVPHLDPHFREARDKLRITSVKANEARAFWLDIYVPASTAGGNEVKGTIVVSAASGRSQTLPFTIRIRGFTLTDPDDEESPSSFGLSALYDSNGGNTQQDYARTAQLYAEAALMHRISLRSAISTAPEVLQKVQPDWPSFGASGWLDLLRGKALPFGFTNAKLGSVEMPAPICRTFYTAPSDVAVCSDADKASQVAFWKNFIQWFTQQGFQNKLFAYLSDEPLTDKEWLELFASSKAVQSADGSSGSLKMLVTTTPAKLTERYLALESGGTADQAATVADLFCPLVNDLVGFICPAAAVADSSGAASYLGLAGSTKTSLWAYESCMSHGCDGGCNTTTSSNLRSLYGGDGRGSGVVGAGMDKDIRSNVVPGTQLSSSSSLSRPLSGNVLPSRLPNSGLSKAEEAPAANDASLVPAPASPSDAAVPVCPPARFPSYTIDSSLVSNRIMTWILYLYDIKAELYWSTTWQLASHQYKGIAAGKEWERDGMFAFGGQGDGTLFYRGLPSIIGGSKEIPIASLRLKAIRDGRSDWLVMREAEKKVGRAEVLAIVRKVVTTASDWKDDPFLLLRAREELEVLAEDL